MQIDLNRDGEKLTAVMHGRIDTVSAPEAEEILLNALAQAQTEYPSRSESQQ